MKIKSILSALLLMISTMASAQYLNVKLEDGSVRSFKTTPNMKVSFGDKAGTEPTESEQTVTVGDNKVTVKLSEDAGIENDVYLKATTDGSSVTIKSHSALTGRRTSCTCTPAGKATCTPSIDATTGICTFTITDVQDDITAEVGYFEYEIAAEVTPVVAGTVTGAGIYAKGSTATLAATAGGSFAEFVGWAKAESPGTIISTNNPYKFTVSQSASYVAVFRLNGALSGVFTVAADEQGKPKKKVQFSKGNLWYGKAGDAGEATFNFEANQYDTTPSSNGDREPKHISHFMWCKTPEKAMTLKYDDNWNGETPFFAAKNFTVNGYSGWSVLTGGNGGEWEYLLNMRNTTYGENRRYAAVMVNGMAGLLIFPDDFSSWPSKDAGTEPQTFNTYSENWNGKDYTVAEFTVLQNNGCVFLPAAGYREGSDGLAFVDYVGYDGVYWSASPDSDDYYAYDLYFSSGSVAPSGLDARSFAQSVRLVTEVK